MKPNRKTKALKKKQKKAKSLRDGVRWAETSSSRHPEKKFLLKEEHEEF